VSATSPPLKEVCLPLYLRAQIRLIKALTFVEKFQILFCEMIFRDRPLLPSSLDSKLYLARPDLERALLEPLRQDRNVLLLGEAGSGKTTLMRRVAKQLEKEERRTVWVNGSLAETAAELLASVNSALGGSPPPGVPEEAAGGSGRLLALTQALAAHRPAVIMVDGLTETEVGFDLFGRVRDELWMAGHTWLVSIRPQDSAALRSPPAEAFWAAVVEIPPLDEREVSEFLRLGLERDEWRQLHKIPFAGHPRFLIREVESALKQKPEPKETGIRALLERASQLGRSEEIALLELINLGRPASVHDPELSKRLGWSRPYAQRIFSSLESEGLVRSIPEARGERTGRPRKLYEPNPGAIA
jgi:predicted transcriptional regulator